MAKNIWTLDPDHSEIEFKVKHMMITNVKGNFKSFNVEIDGEDITSANIKTTIDVSTINTNNGDRDKHLKSADFFNVEKYPEILFVSTSLNKVENDEYTLTGNLTIKDVTKEIKLDVEYGGISKDPWGNNKAGFSLTGKLNRKDFGLNWNAALETGGVMVSEEVKISAEVEFTQTA